MHDKYIHIYEKIPLCTAGIVMGLILILIHLFALLKPETTRKLLLQQHTATSAGQMLLSFCGLWFILLILDTSWNPLKLELFEFDRMRPFLIILTPITCYVLMNYVKENIFARALGLFLLMALCLPLSAAYLKDPTTRILIPIWCYPVLTMAMFWVAKPYLLRDWLAWLCARPILIKLGAAAGLAYGVAILLCAILFW